MSLAQRLDVGRRLGTSKAQMPDEALTRSQVIPGQNIWFEYLANWDIKIHSAVTGGTAAEGNRFLVTTFELVEQPSDKIGFKHFKIESLVGAAIGSADNKRYFGTEYFFNVNHNWELPSAQHFIYSISSVSDEVITGTPKYNETQPRVIGYNPNTVQIQGTVKPSGTYACTVWADNTKTRLIDISQAGQYDTSVVPQGFYSGPDKYALRIMEITDPLTTTTGVDTLDVMEYELGFKDILGA